MTDGTNRPIPSPEPAANELGRFFAQLRGRLEAGAREYGNSTFERPLLEVVDELLEEAADIAGWGYMVWLRIERLRAGIRVVEQGGSRGGS